MVVTLHQKEMLPRNFPKFGGFLVNRATKFGRIELDVQVHELCFGFHRNIFAFKDTLGRCLGCIIPFEALLPIRSWAISLKDGWKKLMQSRNSSWILSKMANSWSFFHCGHLQKVSQSLSGLAFSIYGFDSDRYACCFRRLSEQRSCHLGLPPRRSVLFG